MLAKFYGLNPKGPYLSFEKEKENFCVLPTYSIKRANEIRKFHVAARATTAKKCKKTYRDARAKLFFCQFKAKFVVSRCAFCIFWVFLFRQSS